MNDSPDQAPASSRPTAPDAQPSRRYVWFNPWLIIALLALGLAIWQWVETRIRLADTQQIVARRLAESDEIAKENRLLAKQAQDQLVVLQGKIGELDGKLAESKSQQATLETLYQDLASNRDEWILAEIEQSVTLASQQLQLAANVQHAVLALQAADARLAGDGRPQFIMLRKALVRDLDRLLAVPKIDMPGINQRLESVIAVMNSLPLAVDERPNEESAPKGAAEQNTEPLISLAYWQRAAVDVWHEVRGLVRIQRFDRNEPVLLAPGQTFFLRENLKLRLLNARLALFARDQWTFQNELKEAQSWVNQYFDNREKSVLKARDSLTQLAATEITINVPNVNESLAAIKNFKLTREGK